jgi:glycosyltransferase involved in cell wall biosynthesis
MKVAIIHPWFLMLGGGEKVVDVIASLYPEADIFTLFFKQELLPPKLRDRKITTSILNSFPFSAKLHFHYAPLYPWATEGLDLSEYDLLISSCGPVLMGVNAKQDAVHVCYCHTPPRAWWDLYAEHQANMPWLAKQVFVMAGTFVRMWEFNAMQRMDHVISNSHYIAHRVQKYFRRDSSVIYPPVDTSNGYLDDDRSDYYLTVGRLGRQKRLDLIVQACNALGRKLKIVGTGKEEAALRSLAGPTIEFLGYVPDAELGRLYARCRAFVFAANEDFGIAPVEAQSFGRPVIAYGHGGSLETVRVSDPEGRPDTGIFFAQQTVDSLINALMRFEQAEDQFDPAVIQQHAKRFDTGTFVAAMTKFVDNARQKAAHS